MKLYGVDDEIIISGCELLDTATSDDSVQG